MGSKTVLVTGASRGIGFHFVKRYIDAGWTVIATARDPTNAQALKHLARTRSLDSSCGQGARRTPIDLLINNAGIDDAANLVTTTKAGLIEAFVVNAVGPFLVTRALAENLRLVSTQRGSSIVVMVSSLLGSITINAGGDYEVLDTSTRAAAVNMITTCLASDLKGDNIIVVAVMPGLVSTDLTHNRGLFLPDVAVTNVCKTLDTLTPTDTAKFFDVTGPELPW